MNKGMSVVEDGQASSQEGGRLCNSECKSKRLKSDWRSARARRQKNEEATERRKERLAEARGWRWELVVNNWIAEAKETD